HGAHHDRLDDAALANRVGELCELGIGKNPARIVRIGLKECDRHPPLVAASVLYRLGGRSVADVAGQRREAAAEPPSVTLFPPFPSLPPLAPLFCSASPGLTVRRAARHVPNHGGRSSFRLRPAGCGGRVETPAEALAKASSSGRGGSIHRRERNPLSSRAAP